MGRSNQKQNIKVSGIADQNATNVSFENPAGAKHAKDLLHLSATGGSEAFNTQFVLASYMLIGINNVYKSKYREVVNTIEYDYLTDKDNWVLTERVRELSLSGEDNWEYFDSTKGQACININDMAYAAAGQGVGWCDCVPLSSNWSTDSQAIYFGASNHRIYLKLTPDVAPDLKTFKQYLNDHPILVYYELATPEITLLPCIEEITTRAPGISTDHNPKVPIDSTNVTIEFSAANSDPDLINPDVSVTLYVNS